MQKTALSEAKHRSRKHTGPNLKCQTLLDACMAWWKIHRQQRQILADCLENGYETHVRLRVFQAVQAGSLVDNFGEDALVRWVLGAEGVAPLEVGGKKLSALILTARGYNSASKAELIDDPRYQELIRQAPARRFLRLRKHQALMAAAMYGRGLEMNAAALECAQHDGELGLMDAVNGHFVDTTELDRWLNRTCWTLAEAVMLVNGFPGELAAKFACDIYFMGVYNPPKTFQDSDGETHHRPGSCGLLCNPFSRWIEAARQAAVIGDLDAVRDGETWRVRPVAFLRWFTRARYGGPDINTRAAFVFNAMYEALQERGWMDADGRWIECAKNNEGEKLGKSEPTITKKRAIERIVNSERGHNWDSARKAVERKFGEFGDTIPQTQFTAWLSALPAKRNYEADLTSFGKRKPKKRKPR